MDPNELESFVAVCRTGSFTMAARQRGLTQPAVSRHVQRLERELRARLLVRDGKYVVLTEAGERLLAYADELLSQQARFLDAFRQSDENALGGELNIAGSTTCGQYLVPPMLARFTRDHPRVHPQLFVGDAASVAEEVAEGRWELGFVGLQVRGRGLQYQVVGQDEVVLAVPPGHIFEQRHEISASELRGHRVLEREAASGTMRTFRAGMEAAGVVSKIYRPLMVLNSPHAILAAVSNGLGLGVVSSIQFGGYGFERIHYVRIADAPMIRDIYMLRRRTRPVSTVASAFADWVLQQPTQQLRNRWLKND